MARRMSAGPAGGGSDDGRSNKVAFLTVGTTRFDALVQVCL